MFYGDKNNWWATYALWVLQLFGIENVKILDATNGIEHSRYFGNDVVGETLVSWLAAGQRVHA